MEVFDEMLVRSIGCEDPRALDHVARAMVNRAALSGIFEQDREYLALLDETIERFEDSDRPEQSTAARTARRLLASYRKAVPE